LIELLVAIAIIALLISILLPSLSKAREQAKKVVCASTLSGFGKGFALYADNDRYGSLCSGAFDPEVSNGRDGPVDKVGWVRDLKKFDYADPGRQLCPSNVAVYNQKLRLYLDPEIVGEPEPPSTASSPEERVQELIDLGFNTNYTQSWFMGRTQYRGAGAGSLNLKRLDSTMGPLRLSAMVTASPSKVPLLGDGRTDNDEPLFGERCVKTMSDGPFGGPYGTQNYADFGPAHGYASWIRGDKGHNRVYANVLFGDAHVDTFRDSDRDGEFALDVRKRPAEQTDLNPGVIFDGVLSLGRRSRSATSLK
jgi:prepilin-type processing-associated H-X9-DG protein